MPQVLKEHVREALVLAAAETFAELGYEATTMAAVASRAGSSIGNLYKYFASKQQLFEAAVPPTLVTELTQRTRARMRALGSAKDVRELGAGAEYHALAGDLLDYCLRHRAAVVVVLARAEGTAFAGFKRGFVRQLVNWALAYARVPYPRLRPSGELRFALTQAYAAFVSAVAEALRTFPEESQTRRVIALLTAQHQGGLKRLFEHTEGEHHAESSHAEPPPFIPTASGARVGDARAGDAGPIAPSTGAGKADRPRRSRGRR